MSARPSDDLGHVLGRLEVAQRVVDALAHPVVATGPGGQFGERHALACFVQVGDGLGWYQCVDLAVLEPRCGDELAHGVPFFGVRLVPVGWPLARLSVEPSVAPP